MAYGAGDKPGGKPTTKTVKVRAHAQGDRQGSRH